MNFTCSQCGSPLSQGVTQCQRCGMRFATPVPAYGKNGQAQREENIRLIVNLVRAFAGLCVLAGIVVGVNGGPGGAGLIILFGLPLIWSFTKLPIKIRALLTALSLVVSIAVLGYSFTPSGRAALVALRNEINANTTSTGPSPSVPASTTPVATMPVKKPLTHKHTFSELKISQASIAGDTVHVVGDTDLPDGASLTVTLDVPGRSEDATSIAVSQDAIVNGGRFSADLTRPDRPEFFKRRCIVNVMFSPFAQTTEVQAIVGANG